MLGGGGKEALEFVGGQPYGLGLVGHSWALQQAPLLADRLVSIFRRIYGDNLGPRSEDILHAGLLTLALHGGQTLPMLPLLFTHAGYRRRLTATLNDPLGLGSFWSWFEGTSEAERRAATAPLMNKLRAVLLRPSLRRALGQAGPRFSVRQVFTERKILLVNLAKGDLGPETAQLFGALLLNEVWQQTLARTSLPAERRALVTLHVDEFHEYLRLPTPLADVLVAARGYGLGLTIATNTWRSCQQTYSQPCWGTPAPGWPSG